MMKHTIILAPCLIFLVCYVYVRLNESSIDLKDPPLKEPDSVSRILRRGDNANKRNLDDEDPCNRPNPLPGQAGSVGVLYVVAGSEGFAEHAMIPLVEYLRNNLGIPDAASRGPDEPKWAIATEKHICQGALRPVLPFFDVVMTDFEVHALPIFTHQQPGRHNRRLDLLGNWKQDWQDAEVAQKHYIKGFKVTAMENSPFEKTIYLDTDSVPCEKNFPERLVKALGDADVALTPHYNEGFDIPVNDPQHWEIMGNRGMNRNVHCSACMVMNMASVKTRQLLKLWKVGFFKMFKTMDQYALGDALWYMYHEKQIDHVDLEPSLYADPHKLHEKGIFPTCDGSGDWMIIHKTRIKN